VKAPEEFVPTVNDRHAGSESNPGRQSKPAIIVFTLILGLLTFVVGLTGFFHSMKVAAILWHDGTTFPLWADLLVRDIPQLGLSSAAFYACLKRPAWGRAVCLVFVTVLYLMLLWSPTSPSRYPLFTVTILAEYAGSAVQIVMIVGMMIYTGAMLFGSTARAYFFGRSYAK
jgi:hypothetical protein